ncbi:MAG: ribulose-phosphate 3-epimerase [Anaerolineae bacterium]
MIEIAPSILAADFSRLGEQVRDCLKAGITRIHMDVMDGQFVPNITFGPLVVEALRPLADSFGAMLETHLMIIQPERYLADFIKAGADLVIVHVETCPHLHRTVQNIHQLGAKAGVVINPATPLATLEEILPDADQILLMTVNPGFGGQELIPATLDKISRLRRTLAERNLSHIPIEVDGGVNRETIETIARAGADIFVAGSAVFNSRASVAENLKSLLSVTL